MSLVLIDATSTSLTVSWPPTDGAKRYILEYRKVNDNNEDNNNNNNNSFERLSDKLIQTQARKRNLSNDDNNKGYIFRAGAILNNNDNDNDNNNNEEPLVWMTHSEPYQLLSNEEEQLRMDIPKVSTNSGTSNALLIRWEPMNKNSNTTTTTKTTTYELQMRENQGGIPWKTIASSLSGYEVKKKNCISKFGYQFRIAPSITTTTTTDQQQNSTKKRKIPFSLPSDIVVATTEGGVVVSNAIKRWFNTLENNTFIKYDKVTNTIKDISLNDALCNKEFILLYASAHWCPPCRQFTPMLAQWYNSLQSKSRQSNSIEIIFLSCDHDENSFLSYFKQSHPWLSINFDDDIREQLLGTIKVSGIPRLVVINATTGTIVEDNVVGKSFDINRWRQLSSKK